MPIEIIGYEITGECQRHPQAVLLRAVRKSDNQEVFIKTIDSDYPPQGLVANLRREFQILERLQNVAGVIESYGIEEFGNGNFAIIQRSFGNPLSELIAERQGAPFSQDRFFKIALQLAKIIGALHQENIVHKSITPDSIFLDRVTDDVRLANFTLASELSLERQDINTSRLLEGSLPYISPEQTGRMNRNLDYRSDYYSLGITLFEILTGQLPFNANNTLEWLHCHIGRTPPAAVDLDSEIPAVLSDIIAKLIAKNVEDRYQSSFGIAQDLERCLQQLQEKSQIDPFPLAERDVSEKFLIPQKLYGREEELRQLQNVYSQASDGSVEICFISGFSGIGKSALVGEIHKTILSDKGFFIEGKFDQLQRNTPYSAISIAIGAWIDQQLTESAEHLAQWREDLIAAMGPNAGVMLNLVPRLEKIIGPQPDVPLLPPTEAQNRLQIVFQNFVSVLASADHPLVIFLDDMQWSDAPTMNLIQRLVTGRETQYLFVIGAYRDNEVEMGHPLLMLRDEIAAQTDIHELFLSALMPETVQQIVADTLRTPKDNVTDLAEILFQKSEGNPFFLIELFKTLHEDGYIEFQSDQGTWHWQADAIRQADISDSVVDFMIGNLKKLPKDTVDILQLASCIGNRFDLKTLSTIDDQDVAQTNAYLLPAIHSSMIIPLDEGYKFVDQNEGSSITEGSTAADQVLWPTNPIYRFQHDRVQQAALSLIEGERKQQVHLTIGRLMQKQLSAEEQEDQLIDIAWHLNEGRRLMTSASERSALIEMNLAAGIKAHDASAYTMALQFLETGLSLLPDDAWTTSYETAYRLNLQYTQCAYLTGHHDRVEEQIATLLAQVKTPLEKAEILSMRTRQLATMGRMDASIDAAIDGLKLLNVDITKLPSKTQLENEMRNIERQLGNRPIADLISAPMIEDPEQAMAIRLLMEIFPAAFLSGSGNLFQFLVLKSVALSMEHGNSPEAAFAFAGYGMLLCGVLNDPKTGYQYGQLALAMNEQFEDITLKSRIIYVYAMFIHHWSHHWTSMTNWFRMGIETGYQSGDLLYLAFSAQDCIIWDPTIDLPTASAEQEKYLMIVKDCEYQDSLDSGTLFLQMQLNFQGLTDSRYSLNTDTFDEEICLAGMQDRKFMTGVANYHIYKTEIAYLYGDMTRARFHMRIQDKLILSAMSLPQLVRYTFVAFLTLAKTVPPTSDPEHKSIRQRLIADVRQMQIWAKNCPDNFQHLYLAMSAEIERLSEHNDRALTLYGDAIAAAHKSGFLRDEAMINELAGEFFNHQGLDRAAEGYFRAALHAFHRWGATRKVKQMQEIYPVLKETQLASNSANSPIRNIQDNRDAFSVAQSALDMTSVMKGARAISGEVVLEQLWKTIMHIVLENAGAQRGFFVTKNGDMLNIEVLGEISKEEISITLGQSTAQSDLPSLLPISMVNYALRTGEPVILDDANQSDRFAQDPYIQATQAKSVICFPIIRPGHFEGALYMENNLATGAFVEDRVEIIELLVAQAAISLENAQLYTDLEQKVRERTFALSEKSNALEQLSKQLAKYLSPQVYQSIFDRKQEVKLVSERKDLTIFFSDIVGFTETADRIASEELTRLLNHYLTEMSDIALAHGATIDKYVGDAIVIFFGDPETRGLREDALACVRMAIAMRDRMAELRTIWSHRGIGTTLQCRMGINTGPCTVGNFGSEARMDYTIIGSSVNLASRLETAADPGQILISSSTFDLIQHEIECEDRGTITVKGITEPVATCQVIGPYKALSKQV